MEQELIKPDVPPKGSSQAISPLGCFIAASGITLLTLCLLGTAALTTIWAFSKLLGLPEVLTQGLMVLGLLPAIIATIWTGGRAWHVERRLAQHQDIDVPNFQLLHYFKKS
ncbi:MAG: hypothetical protein ABL936_08540 [Aestuariivirga sp.]